MNKSANNLANLVDSAVITLSDYEQQIMKFVEFMSTNLIQVVAGTENNNNVSSIRKSNEKNIQGYSAKPAISWPVEKLKS